MVSLQEDRIDRPLVELQKLNKRINICALISAMTLGRESKATTAEIDLVPKSTLGLVFDALRTRNDRYGRAFCTLYAWVEGNDRHAASYLTVKAHSRQYVTG